MESLIVAIADAVKASLNAATFSEPFTAERHYQPLFELKDMKVLHVSVVPSGVAITTLGRGRSQVDVKIDVAVQKKLGRADAEEIDSLMGLVEEIAEHFKAKRLASSPEAVWVKTENAPIYAQEHMAELRQFTSVLTFTFRVMQ
jgi:hypothetical protein